ncbi:DUF4097 family beta strand repeat-containing protein [Staphylococcus edaphicus]|uniref:DUF4097 domain-containing protein n=1 Tax=Staphylococcus edaphicus TaxID=1955013 RepID=A0A2C6WMI5_9STAP|nr:DUF4097 family beta strand repeat-containing protein [Staphylococcus edaphicus]PHK50310.1 hypothetical protein BTJ66_04355 [Staphylococcus edaphicus]UQW82096.1 DUF4097 domain-containing protein [Staphylococcus edaphicus]
MKKPLILIFIVGVIITTVCAVGAIQQFKIENKKANQITTNFDETYNKQNIKKLDLDLNHSNVKIKKGKSFKVVSKGSSKRIKMNAKIKDGTLVVNDHKDKSNIDISFLDMRYNDIVITLPQKLSSLKIKSDNGSTDLVDIAAEKTKLDTDAGDLTIKHATFKQLVASGDTSDINIAHTQFQRGDFKTDTGNVLLRGTPADKPIQISTDTGDVQLIYGKEKPKDSQIDFSSDTGNLNIEDRRLKNKEIGNGMYRIAIKTDTGDATIK